MCPGPKPGPFENFDDAAWTGAFNMCLLSYVRTIRAVLPSMKRLGGGRIVNSTSSSVKDCLDNLILSNTMRMGVVGMSKTLAREVGKDNILINVIGPGRIGTARIESLNKMRADKAGISVSDYEKRTLRNSRWRATALSTSTVVSQHGSALRQTHMYLARRSS